jgi:hypothetical protein
VCMYQAVQDLLRMVNDTCGVTAGKSVNIQIDE